VGKNKFTLKGQGNLNMKGARVNLIEEKGVGLKRSKKDGAI